MFKFFSKTAAQDKISEKSANVNIIDNNLVNYISHEVRTPIHGVANIALFLHENWDNIDDQERKKYLAIISNNSQRLINFTNELLDLSKFQAGKMLFEFKEINILAIINEIFKNFQNMTLVNKDLEIIFNSNITESWIMGDEARMIQVFNNLFNNAIKYTSKGSIIAELNIIYLNEQKYVEFSLTDTGVGIPEQELESIFEIFARSSRTNLSISGSGIGLSICKEIIVAHEGSIKAENNLESGSKFTFVIPTIVL
jgi:two-component system sensor histidine kinase ChiS